MKSFTTQRVAYTLPCVHAPERESRRTPGLQRIRWVADIKTNIGAARSSSRTETDYLEDRSRRFAAAVESSTLPPAALDAALSNLAAVREEGKLRVVAFGREVHIVPDQTLAVSLRG